MRGKIFFLFLISSNTLLAKDYLEPEDLRPLDCIKDNLNTDDKNIIPRTVSEDDLSEPGDDQDRDGVLTSEDDMSLSSDTIEIDEQELEEMQPSEEQITFHELKHIFLTSIHPKPPKYKPMPQSNFGYPSPSLALRKDLAPFKYLYPFSSTTTIVYRNWFVEYSQQVNNCIALARQRLYDIFINKGGDFENAGNLIHQGIEFSFNHCTQDFKGFNIGIWQIDDFWFEPLTYESVPHRGKVSRFMGQDFFKYL